MNEKIQEFEEKFTNLVQLAQQIVKLSNFKNKKNVVELNQVEQVTKIGGKFVSEVHRWVDGFDWTAV